MKSWKIGAIAGLIAGIIAGIVSIFIFNVIALVYGRWLNWIGHASISIIGLFLVISILVTGSILAGRIKKIKSSDLFKLHKKIGLLFGILIVGTFFYGLLVTSQFGKPVLKSNHGWLGLVIALGVITQLIPSMVIKKRIKIKKIHMIFGYSLALLVILEVAWGIYMTIFQ